MDHLPIITTTAGLISNALSSIKSARELAKGVSDNELKEQIGAAYDTLQDLRDMRTSLMRKTEFLRYSLLRKQLTSGLPHLMAIFMRLPMSNSNIHYAPFASRRIPNRLHL